MAKAMTAAQMLAAMKKWGVQYKEYPGWQTRGRGPMGDVHGVIIHHTGSDSQSDSYLKFLAEIGRPDDGIPAPLCNSATDMDGDVWLIAATRANHAGAGSTATLTHVIDEDYAGTAYKGPELKPGTDNIGGTAANGMYYGNEVRFDGGQPMTVKQFASAVRWAAAICDFHGWSAMSVIGHREHTHRKPDPQSCFMYTFRGAVAALLKAGPTIVKPGGTVARTLTDDDLAAIGAVVKFQNEDYGRRLWALDTGTGKKLVIDVLADHTLRLQRIEDDTDDGTPVPA